MWVDRPTVPLPDRLPSVWLPPSCRLAPVAMLSAGRAVRRLAALSVSVPPLMATVPAAAVPLRVLLPSDCRAPVPKLALTVPPSSA